MGHNEEVRYRLVHRRDGTGHDEMDNVNIEKDNRKFCLKML